MTARAIILNGLLALVGRLPFAANQRLGSLLGWMVSRWANKTRRIAAANIAMCWPELDPDEQQNLVRDSLIETGRAATEIAFFWRQPSERVLAQIRQIHGLELFDAAIAADRGILLAAPHLGAWELLCQYLSTRMPCAILYREPRHPGIGEIITQARERLGAELIRADARGVRRLFRAAKEKKLIGILPDQQPKRGGGEFAPFFGQPALTMVLYSRLAARTDCTPLIGWAERLSDNRGYDLHFVTADQAIRSADVSKSIAALNAAIEQQVRRCPAQYQWSYKRFDWQPNGKSPYRQDKQLTGLATPKDGRK